MVPARASARCTNAEIVKGYEFEKGRWVVVSDEDIAKVKTESTKVINLMQFADDDAIDPMYVDKAYYLAPDGPMAADAYAVMREGMKGKAGIGKVAIHGREYLVAVKPHKQGLVMYTLHHAAEIRTIDQIDELREVRGKVKPAEMKLARQVIESFDRRAQPAGLHGRIPGRAARRSSTRKIAGRGGRAPPEVEAPPKVVDLMEALRKSLDQVSAGQEEAGARRELRRRRRREGASRRRKRARRAEGVVTRRRRRERRSGGRAIVGSRVTRCSAPPGASRPARARWPSGRPASRAA